MDVAREFGYTDVYFYGTDEAKGERLTIQRAAWKSVQDAVARRPLSRATAPRGDRGLLNPGGARRAPESGEARSSTMASGADLLLRLSPGGNEEPSTGAIPGPSSEGATTAPWTTPTSTQFGHIWERPRPRHHRDHCFTYPTVNGVGYYPVGGYREAVDDVALHARRCKVRSSYARARRTPRWPRIAARWLEGVDPQGDRRRSASKCRAEWITRLSAQR